MPTFLSVYANVPVTVYESVPTNAVAKSLIEIVGSVWSAGIVNPPSYTFVIVASDTV